MNAGQVLPSLFMDPAQILDRIADAFACLDTGWRFTYINRKATQVLECSEEQVIGNILWNTFPRPPGDPFFEACFEAVQTQQPAQIEAICPTFDRWFEYRIYPGPDGLTIFFQDISDRKAAEQDAQRIESALRESETSLRLALASGGLESYVVDLERREFLTVSAGYKALFGVAPDAEFTYGTLVSALHPDDRDQIREKTYEAIWNGQPYSVEGRCVWPDGTTHWISAHGSPVCDDSGRPIRIVGVAQEITSRKLHEAAQERALREAHDRADRDPLTSLLNHRAFYKRLDEECARSRRDDTVLAVVVVDVDNFRSFNDVYGHATGDIVLRQVADRLQQVCRPYDTVARFGGDEFALLLANTGGSTVREIEARLGEDLDGLTYLPDTGESAIPITLSLGGAQFDHNNSDRHEVVRLAAERMRWLKSGGEPDEEAESVRHATLRNVEGFSMLDALVAAVDNKDRYTRRHSEDVMTYSLMIARELGLDEETQHTIAVAALLHDVGKIGVPDAILRKPSSLTRDEYDAIRQHPQMGAAIVSAVPGLEKTLDAVRHHHECWDGSGYPDGLRGEEIPMIARLMAVADAYNAMTTNRPYRQAMEHPKAMAILERGAGAQWDTACVAAFRSAMDRELAES